MWFLGLGCTLPITQNKSLSQALCKIGADSEFLYLTLCVFDIYCTSKQLSSVPWWPRWWWSTSHHGTHRSAVWGIPCECPLSEWGIDATVLVSGPIIPILAWTFIIRLQPFTHLFPCADICQLLAPDILHQLVKGAFKDHLVEWVGKYLALVYGKNGAKDQLVDIDWQ